MRRWSLVFSGILVVSALRGASGCFVDFANDCQRNNECCRDGTMNCHTADAGTGGNGTGGGDAGTGGSTPAGCIPSENLAAVADTCGVFVSSTLGDDMNAGTAKDKPVKTLADALTKAKGKPVYACGESFTETVTIQADATLYGALDCTSDWRHVAEKNTQLTAGADAMPLTVGTATTSASVYDFAITSANAAKPGGSSIAVLVTQATASFTRCDVTAGNGMAGAPGEPFMGAEAKAQAGTDGLAGNVACTANTVVGADTVTNMCGTADSTSGLGGNGSSTTGGAGSPGQPQSSMNFGTGENATDLCKSGNDGDPGTAGSSGPGATAVGTLSASGYTGASGSPGNPGSVAQGGGGGGGAKGGTGTGKCPLGMTGGASGASGGSGGCGGQGGKGGGFGGASFALVSINATLTFVGTKLTAGLGGAGGDGGPGQAGGDGGGPGAGGKAKPMFANLNDGCAGGKGGVGGPGGKGGGGTGGHAIGIAATGKAPPPSGVVFTQGTPGMGGLGEGAMGNGAMGKVADCWSFDTNAVCK